MGGSRAPSLRRRPNRASAEEIVGSVLSAAALLLDRDGIEGLTTNGVARVAGVSVGSLYQYFPDKQAIIAEIARRIEATALAITGVEVVRLQGASAREAVSRVVSLSCSPAFGTAALRRAILREVPRGWTLDETRSTDTMIGDVLTAFFTARADQVRAIKTSHAVFVVQHACEGVVEAVLLASPEALPEPRVQSELWRLAWSYLAPEDDSLERPPIDETGLPPMPLAPDPALEDRLLTEPSRRRVASARGRARSTRSLATRRALLEAAERVLARDGFAGLSVRAIATEAGVGTGTLYGHFRSAEEMIAEVASQLERRAEVQLAQRLDASLDVAAAVVGAYTSETVASDALRRAILREVPRRWIEATSMEVLRSSVARVARAIQSVPGRDAELVAFVVLHAVKAVADSFFLLAPRGLDRATLQAELRELVRRHIGVNDRCS